ERSGLRLTCDERLLKARFASEVGDAHPHLFRIGVEAKDRCLFRLWSPAGVLCVGVLCIWWKPGWPVGVTADDQTDACLLQQVVPLLAAVLTDPAVVTTPDTGPIRRDVAIPEERDVHDGDLEGSGTEPRIQDGSLQPLALRGAMGGKVIQASVG